jgi:RNA polymerase sigma-70 factor (ECF subfamily)
VEEQTEFNALKHEIFEALAALPPRQRAVIIQRYYLEMTEKEMAEALQAPPGTVKWLLNAARARLRSLLGRERMSE